MYEDNQRLRDYILARIIIRPNGCWEWQLGKDKGGYGKASANGGTIRAHRLSFSAFVRELGDNEQGLHKCDNPPCCNPEHIYAGTHQNNVDDKVRKGRQIKERQCWKTKLDLQDSVEIKVILSSGLVSQTKIGEMYGVSQFAISQIALGKSWAWPDRDIAA